MIDDGGIAAQFTPINALSARFDRLWIARAINSFPVPVSPRIRTVESEGATFAIGLSTLLSACVDPSVAGLVYVAAHMPDSGEKESEDGKRFPSDLAKSGAIKKTPDGFTYIDPVQFHEFFAADLPADQAAFMARSQVLNVADNFSATITTAAWRTKPSWMVVAGSDRTINPDLERWYAKRAKSQTVEVAGASHSVYVSHPKEVADVIESAARAVSPGKAK